MAEKLPAAGAPRTLDKHEWPPNYLEVFRWRQQQLLRMRTSPGMIIGAREYYRTRPVEFINHWGTTYDPRLAGTETPAYLPFVLFRRQAELVQFLHECLVGTAPALVDKSRDMGATWAGGGFSAWLWLFWPGSSVGWGSKDQDLVDKLGNPAAILEKIRIFIKRLPREFWPDKFDPVKHMSFMRIVNPETGATITGDVGDNIGRGDRKLIYFKDESAHYIHPDMIEAALGDTTRVQVDISSVNGPSTVFERKKDAGVFWVPGRGVQRSRTNVFVLDWSDHPEKTQEWHDARERQARAEGLLHVFRQEVERNPLASVDGVIVPYEHFRAAVGAAEKLGILVDGPWSASLDVADRGLDLNSLCLGHGIQVEELDQWGDRDPGVTTRRALGRLGTVPGPVLVQYDCVGVGASVRSEYNRLLEEDDVPAGVVLVAWDASKPPQFPDRHVVPEDRTSPLNKDIFLNLKAQGWWQLSQRFLRTFRAVQREPGFVWVPEDIVSISPNLPMLRQLEKEVCQPVWGRSTTLKLVVDKTPDGAKSPNLGDSVMMWSWPYVQRRLPNFAGPPQPQLPRGTQTVLPPLGGQRILPGRAMLAGGDRFGKNFRHR